MNDNLLIRMVEFTADDWGVFTEYDFEAGVFRVAIGRPQECTFAFNQSMTQAERQEAAFQACSKIQEIYYRHAY